eukprot:GILJ01008041.1.p1 GENE.GILJ01008041.1~~GILJ01008041.1.p1  ORF type:complete len:237 (+),score=14.99 GILJ01008041.1:29-739(+)
MAEVARTPATAENILHFVKSLALNPTATVPESEALKKELNRFRRRIFKNASQTGYTGVKRKENEGFTKFGVMNVKRPRGEGEQAGAPKRSLSPTMFRKSAESVKVEKPRGSTPQDVSGRTQLLLEDYLRITSTMYYGTKVGASDESKNDASRNTSRFRFSTLDMLVSPVRQVHILESWTPRDIALFESGVCKYGKNFHFIQKLMPHKSTQDIVSFYYIWKTSSHYKIWKENRPQGW